MTNFPVNPEPTSSTFVRRRRSHRRSSRRYLNWLKQNGVDLILTGTLLLGVLLLFNPLQGVVALSKVQSPLVDWFVYHQGTVHLGGLILVTAVLLGLLRLRHRVIYHQRWWARQCPHCQGTHLSRVHRTWFERLMSVVGVPMRRYICKDCRWQGPRIDETRI